MGHGAGHRMQIMLTSGFLSQSHVTLAGHFSFTKQFLALYEFLEGSVVKQTTPPLFLFGIFMNISLGTMAPVEEVKFDSFQPEF